MLIDLTEWNVPLIMSRPLFSGLESDNNTLAASSCLLEQSITASPAEAWSVPLSTNNVFQSGTKFTRVNFSHAPADTSIDRLIR